MKTNKVMRAAALMLSLTLVSSCFVGGTFAKYVSEATGRDTARVAKWAFEVNDADITDENTFTFDLFETVNDTGNTSEDDVVAANGSDQIIAPGTEGSFDIKLENLSEVNAKYAVDYTVTNAANIPILFSVDGTNWKTTLDDVLAADDVKLDANGGTETITVQWQWPYEQANVPAKVTPDTYASRDTADTALGIAGSGTVTVTAKVTATQID